MIDSEKRKLAKRKWNLANKDKMREYDRKYYQNNKIEIKIRRLTN